MPAATPESFRKLQVTEFGPVFREATKVVEGHLEPTVPAGHVYVRVVYVGINPIDRTTAMGAFLNGVHPPFDCGYEALGTVVAVAPDVKGIKPGDHVAVDNRGTFGEYISMPAETCAVVPSLDPKFAGVHLSGMTAAISIGELGKPKKGETALVTAAAGGTGQVAVQLLKHVYGCTVIGTCSSEAKAAHLRALGCDHVIDYKKEDVGKRLSELAPNGVDLVYESVGGDMFNTTVKHLANFGRILLIGAMSTYMSDQSKPFSGPNGESLFTTLMMKTASLHGFFLLMNLDKVPHYMAELLKQMEKGQVDLPADPKEFVGLEQIADAVNYLFSGANTGKVVVRIQDV